MKINIGEALLKTMDNMKAGITKNSPAILAGFAVVGTIGTAITSWRSALIAQKILNKRLEDIEQIDGDNVESKRQEINKNTVKKLIPAVLPPVVMSGATIGCIVGSHTISCRRIALLSAAYNISEQTVKDLNTKMTETLGDKKARSVRDAIMKDKLEKEEEKQDLPNNAKNLVVVGDGKVLCLDSYSGRFFYSNASEIEHSIFEISRDVCNNVYASLNDFYYSLGLDGIVAGDEVGWNVSDLSSGQLIPVTISAQMTKDQQPCLCLDYVTMPDPNYRVNTY